MLHVVLPGYLFPDTRSQITEYPALVSNHNEYQIKSFPCIFVARRGCMWAGGSEVKPQTIGGIEYKEGKTWDEREG